MSSWQDHTTRAKSRSEQADSMSRTTDRPRSGHPSHSAYARSGRTRSGTRSGGTIRSGSIAGGSHAAAVAQSIDPIPCQCTQSAWTEKRVPGCTRARWSIRKRRPRPAERRKSLSGTRSTRATPPRRADRRRTRCRSWDPWRHCTRVKRRTQYQPGTIRRPAPAAPSPRPRGDVQDRAALAQVSLVEALVDGFILLSIYQGNIMPAAVDF